MQAAAEEKAESGEDAAAALEAAAEEAYEVIITACPARDRQRSRCQSRSSLQKQAPALPS